MPQTWECAIKELVIRKVRLLIDGLPLKSEGYTIAKNILMTKYGKPSEVTMSLPQINNAGPQKFHEFSEKLLWSVQALDTMGKI